MKICGRQNKKNVGFVRIHAGFRVSIGAPPLTRPLSKCRQGPDLAYLPLPGTTRLFLTENTPGTPLARI